jgi:hypothetical protein
MVKKVLIAGLLMFASTSALAQVRIEASPYAPIAGFPTCTRDELKSLTAAFVEAQRTGNISTLPFDPKAHFLENMQTIDRRKGLWNTALPIDNAVSFHDDNRCKTFTQIIVTDSGHPYVTGTRLWVDKGKIIRMESIVTDKDDWLFNAKSYLMWTKKNGWSEDMSKHQLTSADDLIRGANAYFDSFSDRFMNAPWGTPCGRIEGGAYTNYNNRPHASCELGIPKQGTLYITDRDFMVDTEKGVINVFCRFGGSTGAPDSHTFRFIDGKIRSVNALSIPQPGASPAAVVNDDGSIQGFDPNQLKDD